MKHTLRSTTDDSLLDLIVVGGGINGAGIAADAASRGMQVGLYEARDFAGATSSASSKLIHGGLRYLEHYEFRLVGEALAEREVLLKKAPHIVKPMRFRLPHQPYLRPAWMIRTGLFLYDHLGGKRTSLDKSRKVRLNAGHTTTEDLKVGFEYSDCWVDDARMVVLNVMQAEEAGAEVRNYCSVEKAQRESNHWLVTLFDERTQTRFTRRSKALVNATGPWVKHFLTENIELNSPYGIRLIQGSHIVVPKIHDEEQAYILQNEDKRIVFVIPYMDKYSLIGTTDVEYHGDPRKVAISDKERDYLIDVVNRHFEHKIAKSDIVFEYSGVRPLCDDESDSPQAITRDYTLTLDGSPSKVPVVSVFGGKLTTYRKLAESALHHLQPFFPGLPEGNTDTSLLPGAESYDLDHWQTELHRHLPTLDPLVIKRWLTSYGSRVATVMLRDVDNLSDLGEELAPHVYAKEIDYLMEYEYIYRLEDVIWRRSKLGIGMSDADKGRIQTYIEQKIAQQKTIEPALVD